ncbi:MAG: DUF1194 domain-containing protein [Alphaproteobacteria bacterium]
MLNRRQMLFGSGAALLGAGALFNTSALADTGSGEQRSPFHLVNPPKVPYKHPKYATSSREDVGLAMVCAIDISGSISSPTGEYRTQIEVLGEAIASDDIRQAVFMPGGPGSLALCVIDYSDRSELKIPWVDFREDDPAKFRLLGDEISKIQRRTTGGTTHEAALQNAALCFENLAPWQADNKSVNIMTDGTSSGPGLLSWRRTLAERYGATIYALVTESNNSSTLNPWARNNLITPPNTYTSSRGRPLPAGFVHTVATEQQTQTSNNNNNATGTAAYQGQVRLAIRRQIILQTAGLHIDNYTRFASLEELDAAENPYDFLANDRRFAALRGSDHSFHSNPVITI